jgi:hypothetical protein
MIFGYQPQKRLIPGQPNRGGISNRGWGCGSVLSKRMFLFMGLGQGGVRIALRIL